MNRIILNSLAGVLYLHLITMPLAGVADGYECDSLQSYIDAYDHHFNGDFDSAVFYIDKAIETAGACGDEEREIKLIIRKSDFFSGRGELTEALNTNVIAMSKAKALGDSLLIGRAYIDLVRIMLTTSEYDSALFLLNIAEEFVKPYGNTLLWEDILAYRGQAYDRSGIYEKALVNYMESLQVAETRKDTFEIPGILNNIAIIYKRQEDFASAREYYYQSIEKSIQIDDEYGAAITNVNLGLLEKDLNNFEKADSLLKASLSHFTQIKMSYGIAVVHHNLAELKRKEGKMAEALKNYEKSQELASTYGYKQLSAKNNLSLAQVSFESGNMSMSLDYAGQALKISENQNLLEEKCDTYRILADIYEAMKRPGEALAAYKQFHQLNDSLYNDRKAEIINQQKAKYETHQKDMEIDVLKKEQAFQESEIRASARQSRFFIILSISLAVIFALLAVGFFETRKFNKQLNLRNKEIIRQNNFIESKQKELIRQHQTLQKLSKEKDDLINIVAHDLRSPLNQLKGLITIIKMELLSFFSSETNMYFEKIDVSINTLRDRINRILDVEQINSENVQMVIESLDPNEILSDLQSDFVGEATKKGIKIQFIRNGVSDHIKADLTYTIQVLENLVSNAIKFSKAGEDITLRVSKAGERIRLHVKDNGPGLTKEDQQNLFKKFTRLSAKPTGNEKSIGLGLAIVKKYMENMNGKVWCESEEGKGSEFIAEFDTASLS